MSYRILQGDVLERLRGLESDSVHCVVTSPPYWGLRDYKCEGQIGMEPTPEAFIAKIVEVFREVRRVLRGDGTCWVNMGDAYASNAGGYDATGSRGQSSEPSIGAGTMAAVVQNRRRVPTSGLKAKDLIGLPWMLAFALRADGWWLRQDIIWAKPNPMPSSVRDRCTSAHEYVFLLTKRAHYFYDAEAIRTAVSVETKAQSYATMDFSLRDRYASGKELPPGQANLRAARDKQRGHSRQHAGFNDRWDALEKTEQQINGANKRSVWTIATEGCAEAHFATFPTKLVEPCILAGTSAYGCCSACGAPWTRVVRRSGGTTGKSWHDHSDDLGAGHRSGASSAGMADYRVEILGWKRSCECDTAGGVPCTVLDPFSGAGTTGLVALRLGRNYIGIELNPEYVAMSERRLQDDAPLLRQGPMEAQAGLPKEAA